MFFEFFGIPVEYKEWDKKDSLPLYISESYQFRLAYIYDVRCLILTPKGELDTLSALKKQIAKIQAADNVPIVFELPSISFYRRKSFMENKISFVTKKQAFLPFIGAMLTNEAKPEKVVSKIHYSTQQLLLLYFYGNKKRLYISEAAKKLNYSAMTLSRAARQLKATGFFNVTKDGVNNVIESSFGRFELFEKTKRYMTSPVRNVGYIFKHQITNNMVLAGESALAEKTMLNPNETFTYAVFDKLFDKKMLTNELIDAHEQVRLEMWAYNPKQFANGNIADSISVCLSLSENNDERIEKSIEEMIRKELRN